MYAEYLVPQSLPKDGPVQPSQDDKLQFYALYKQGKNVGLKIPWAKL